MEDRVPAGGVRKPKQPRQKKEDAAAAVLPLLPLNNGQPVKRPEATASCQEIVNYLRQFNIQETAQEVDFAAKAIESLHKKLKDRAPDIETFMRCVETKGEVVGKCIPLARTLDGRLQVAGRKGFPHVIYAKIFRFPELHKNELKSIPSCMYGYDNKTEIAKVRRARAALDKAKKTTTMDSGSEHGGESERGGEAAAAQANEGSNEEAKTDAMVCVNPYHYERVTAPAAPPPHLDPLNAILRNRGFHRSVEDSMDFTGSSSNSQIKLSPSDFLHPRPTLMEHFNLTTGPAMGGFGYSTLHVKTPTDENHAEKNGDPLSSVSSGVPESSGTPLADAVAAAERAFFAARAAEQARALEMNGGDTNGDASMHDSAMTDDEGDQSGADTEDVDMLNMFNGDYDDSEMSDGGGGGGEGSSSKMDIDRAALRLYVAGIEQIKACKVELDVELTKRRMAAKQKENADAEMEAGSLHSDDSDYPEEIILRQRRAREMYQMQREQMEKEDRLAHFKMGGNYGFKERDQADLWNSHYIDEKGNPSYFRSIKWLGEPQNPDVPTAATGDGTFGSKGPHIKPRQKIKQLEWSLQQLIRMLDTVTRNRAVSGAQYMLCCQHYACMIKKTRGAASLDPAQQKLADAAMNRLKHMGGGKMTYQQLHYWDISKIFANHIKTIPERREEKEKEKKDHRSDMDVQWSFDINEEISKVVADTKGTDAEGIFSKRQIKRALEARQKILQGGRIVDESLMACEEMKSASAKKYEESRKRKRAEAGLDEEIEIHPLHPVLENVFTASDLHHILKSPTEYMKSFRAAHLTEDVPSDLDLEEEDLDLRGTVPPAEGTALFQPFDGRERENDEPDMAGEERPPFKKNCLCPKEEAAEHCFWGKHHHYPPGVHREIVDAAFLLYQYRIKRKNSTGPKGELYHFTQQFNCPKVCMARLSDQEPHAAKTMPPGYSWCAVNYFERDTQVGVMKQIDEVNYFIDGGFDGDNGARYCVGCYSNPGALDDEEVEDVRRRIGCGVRISIKDDGSMWVRVLCRFPVFLTSPFLDREAGLVTGDAIHKIYPGGAVKVFDLLRARRAILQMYDYQCEAQKLHTGKKLRKDLPYPLNTFNRRELRSISRIGGDDMQKHAIIKFSFCTGWGPEYEFKRANETPCWTEVIMNRACEFIDHIMNVREMPYALSDLDSSDYDD